jgi:hypothetical protein
MVLQGGPSVKPKNARNTAVPGTARCVPSMGRGLVEILEILRQVPRCKFEHARLDASSYLGGARLKPSKMMGMGLYSGRGRLFVEREFDARLF